MYCTKCGTKNEDDMLYCTKCGESLIKKEEGDKPNYTNEKRDNDKNNDSLLITKIYRIIGIINIVLGALAFFEGIASDTSFDWGIISCLCGLSLVVLGILMVVNVKVKIIAILKIIFGAVNLLYGLLCDLDFDWGYLGLLLGIILLVSGILELLRKSMKSIGINEIVFGAVLIIYGIFCVDYVWGIAGFFCGVAIFVSGIMRIVKLRNVKKY